MNQPWRVGIMGAGFIAQGAAAPDDARVRSLAQAVQQVPAFSLSGFFDQRPERTAAAEEKWNCPASPREREAWLDAGWDVILIATPTEAHANDLESALARRPRGVLVEKPLATNTQDTHRLLTTARDQGTAVLVDFPRRWHPGVLRVGELLAAGTLGAVRRISAVCSGGLRHNGVHLLDLIAAWCPDITSVESIAQRSDSVWLQLPTLSAPVELWFSAAPQRDCYVFELFVETEFARIELYGAPETLCIYRRGDHPIFPGYSTLLPSDTWLMDDEPLLVRGLEKLAALIGDSVAARAQTELEIEREGIFDSVLRHFPN